MVERQRGEGVVRDHVSAAGDGVRPSVRWDGGYWRGRRMRRYSMGMGMGMGMDVESGNGDDTASDGSAMGCDLDLVLLTDDGRRHRPTLM